MRNQLVEMGFTRDQVRALFQTEQNLDNINQAVEYLFKTPNGWTHKFSLNPLTQICRICNEERMQHISEMDSSSNMESHAGSVLIRPINHAT